MPSRNVGVLTCLVISASLVLCCTHQPKSVETPPQASPTIDPAIAAPSPITNKPYPARGVVKLINRKEGWIEINHEPIPDLMPAMEMEWFVREKSLLDHVAVGDKVNFTIVDTGKAQIITELKRVTEEHK